MLHDPCQTFIYYGVLLGVAFGQDKERASANNRCSIPYQLEHSYVMIYLYFSDAVHFKHNDCVWCIGYYKGFKLPI